MIRLPSLLHGFARTLLGQVVLLRHRFRSQSAEVQQELCVAAFTGLSGNRPNLHGPQQMFGLIAWDAELHQVLDTLPHPVSEHRVVHTAP
jgi:hypothetical protein